MKKAILRTNFFRVKSLFAAEEMVRYLLTTKRDIKVHTKVSPDYDVIYGFTSEEEISDIFLQEGTSDEMLYGDFVLGIQKCVADGEQAIVAVDTGAFGITRLLSPALRITPNSIECIDVDSIPGGEAFA